MISMRNAQLRPQIVGTLCPIVGLLLCGEQLSATEALNMPMPWSCLAKDLRVMMIKLRHCPSCLAGDGAPRHVNYSGVRV